MSNELSQGRLRIMTISKSCFELIYSWPNAEKIIEGDSNLLIDFALVWYHMDQIKDGPDLWDEEAVETISKEWIKIKTNTMLDATVKKWSMKFLSNLINVLWLGRLNIQLLRKYKNVLAKASSDLESTTVAGFLKLAVVKYANQPSILSFNGVTRKITKRHFACSIMIVNRGKASSLDIENFYALLNGNGGVELKVCIKILYETGSNFASNEETIKIN